MTHVPVRIGIAHAFSYPNRFIAESALGTSKGPVKAMMTMTSMLDFALTIEAAEMAWSGHD